MSHLATISFYSFMVHLQEKSGSAQLQVTMLLLINHLDITPWGWIALLRLQPTCKYLLLIHDKFLVLGSWDSSRLAPELSNLNRPWNHHLSLTDQIWQDLIQAQIKTTIVSSASENHLSSWFSAGSLMPFTVFCSLLTREEEGGKTCYFKSMGSIYPAVGALFHLGFSFFAYFFLGFGSVFCPGSLCWTQRKRFFPACCKT